MKDIPSPYAKELLPKEIGKDKLEQISKIIGYKAVLVIGGDGAESENVTVASLGFPPSSIINIMGSLLDKLPPDEDVIKP